MVVSSGPAFVAVDYHSGSISRGHIKLRFVAWNCHRISVLGIFYQNYAMHSDCGIAGRVHPYMPFILMFNQMTGAVIKVFMFFNLDRQKWTRQDTGRSKRDTEYSSAMMMWASMAVFTVAVFLFVIMGR